MLCVERILSLTLCVTHAGGVYSIPPAYAFVAGLQTVFGSKRQEAEAYINLQYSARYLETQVAAGTSMRDQLVSQFLAERETEGAPTLQGLVGQLAAVARHYISRKRLRGLKKQLESQGAPVLLLTGTDDNLVRPLNSFILKEILDAKLIVFSGTTYPKAIRHSFASCSFHPASLTGCGHMLNLEKPDLFNRLLAQHLAQATASAQNASKL